MIEVVALRSKTSAYKMDDGGKHKKAKETEEAVIKLQRLLFLRKKPYLKNNKDLKAIIMICTRKKLIRLR